MPVPIRTQRKRRAIDVGPIILTINFGRVKIRIKNIANKAQLPRIII
jgi:hypothetical protein